MAMLQGDSELEAVVVKPGNEEQYLESRRLFAVGKYDLATVKEVGESSFDMNSSRRMGDGSEDYILTGAPLELSEISVR